MPAPPEIVPNFEPGQLINQGQLSEKLHDITLYSSEHPDGLLLNEGDCIKVYNCSEPINNNDREDNVTVEGKIKRFLYIIDRNTGEVKKVIGIKLESDDELVFTEYAYEHQTYTDFSEVEKIPCNNIELEGGKQKRKQKRKHRSIKTKRKVRGISKRKRFYNRTKKQAKRK